MKLLNDLIPEAKPGGRPREVDMWEIRERNFRLSCVRAAVGALTLVTSQPGRRYILNERNWRKDGTSVRIHDHLLSLGESGTGATIQSIRGNH